MDGFGQGWIGSFLPITWGYTGGNVSDIGCIWGDLYGYSNGDNMINIDHLHKLEDTLW